MILDYKMAGRYCLLIITLLTAYSLKAAMPAKQPAPEYSFAVTIDWASMQPHDSLVIFLEDAYYSIGLENIHQPLWSNNKKTRFVIRSLFKRGRFSVRRKTPPGHLNDGSSYKYLPFGPNYNWDAGDDVNFTLIRRHPEGNITELFSFDYMVIFSGRGHEKYIARQNADNAWMSVTVGNSNTVDTVSYRYRNIFTDKIQVAFAEVENYRDRLSSYYYHLYRANIIAGMGDSYHYRLQRFFDKDMIHASTGQRDTFKKTYFEDERKVDSLFKSIPDSVAIRSKDYISFLYKKIRFHQYLKSGKQASRPILDYILSHYKGDLKDRLLIAALQNDSGSGMAELLFNDSFAIIQNAECKQQLDKIAAKMPGYPAFNFRLKDSTDQFVQLSDLKGNVVFIDFWFSHCGACQGYFENTLKQAEEALRRKSNIKFISISIDKAKEYWLTSVRSGNYTADLSINLYTNGEGIDNELIRYYSLQAFPQFIIVDAKGKLHRFYRDLTSPDISNTSALVNTLLKLADTTTDPS